MRCLTLVLWLTAALGCGAGRAPTPAESTVTAPSATWTVELFDGSNNGYRLVSTPDGAELGYRPMTPDQSSSGTYSGGEPWTATVGADAAHEVWQRVTALLDAEAHHAEARAMGTGRLSLTTADAERRAIVKPGAELQSLVEQLQALRGAP